MHGLLRSLQSTVQLKWTVEMTFGIPAGRRTCLEAYEFEDRLSQLSRRPVIEEPIEDALCIERGADEDILVGSCLQVRGRLVAARVVRKGDIDESRPRSVLHVTQRVNAPK